MVVRSKSRRSPAAFTAAHQHGGPQVIGFAIVIVNSKTDTLPVGCINKHWQLRNEFFNLYKRNSAV
jgi:hypothetical protein